MTYTDKNTQHTQVHTHRHTDIHTHTNTHTQTCTYMHLTNVYTDRQTHR